MVLFSQSRSVSVLVCSTYMFQSKSWWWCAFFQLLLLLLLRLVVLICVFVFRIAYAMYSSPKWSTLMVMSIYLWHLHFSLNMYEDVSSFDIVDRHHCARESVCVWPFQTFLRSHSTHLAYNRTTTDGPVAPIAHILKINNKIVLFVFTRLTVWSHLTPDD